MIIYNKRKFRVHLQNVKISQSSYRFYIFFDLSTYMDYVKIAR